MRNTVLLLAGAALAGTGLAGAQAQDDVRWYDRETFTVTYELTGAETGTVVEHVRDWGRLRVEIKDATMSVMGFTQAANQRVIYDGDQIITIDNTTGAVTQTTNPIYAQLAANMDGASGVEFGEQMMVAMGGSRTGETGEFAGLACDYWNVAQMMSVVCVSAEGIALSTASNVAGISQERVAVEVLLDDGGPDEAFEYDASAASSVPSLDDILNSMQGGG